MITRTPGRETLLRRKIREHCTMVRWIEPTLGSSTGLPDCIIKINNKDIELELKAWDLNKNGKFAAKLRPTQVRYHMLAHQTGKRTFIMVLSPSGYIYVMRNEDVNKWFGVDKPKGGIPADRMICLSSLDDARFADTLWLLM